ILQLTKGSSGDTATNLATIMETLQNIQSAINTLTSAINEMKKTSVLVARVATTEQRLSDVEDTMHNSTADTAALQKTINELKSHLDDQENRARWNNVRIIGFPESVEQGKPSKFLEKVLPTILNLAPSAAFKIEWVHRLPKPKEGQRPRPFIIKFLRYPMKEAVLAAAQEKGQVIWQEHRIQFFPDLSRDLQERCQLFSDVKWQLHKRGIKYGMYYPATLRVTVDGTRRSFLNPSDVDKFLQDMPRFLELPKYLD
uniref:L1 transposable element RRM domain-containing protein n=1 Tax=Latimeria chalumnae TaxID=7897 RepID=H3ADG9_LATCH